VDEIAERIRAPGSYAEFSSLSDVAEAKGDPRAEVMVGTLVADQEKVAAVARAVVRAAESAGDDASADPGVRRQDVHEKNAWMLRSHLE
jgi:starvation-inducible DNA-binding protein